MSTNPPGGSLRCLSDLASNSRVGLPLSFAQLLTRFSRQVLLFYSGVYSGASIHTESPHHLPALFVSSHPVINNVLLLAVFYGTHRLAGTDSSALCDDAQNAALQENFCSDLIAVMMY